jgi:hypothetical protein
MLSLIADIEVTPLERLRKCIQGDRSGVIFEGHGSLQDCSCLLGEAAKIHQK